MRPLPLLALALALLSCGETGAGAPSAPAASEFQLEPIVPRVDPEDVFCGVTCEPGSSRPCGAGIEVCDPTGVGWGACGADDYKPAPSLCAKGTVCRRRPSGDPAFCAEACKGGEDKDCNECERRFVFGGLMGCRTICEAEGAAGCEDDQELVRCKAETPTRAEGAGCLPGPEPLTYCCPPGSPILNPPLFCGHPGE
jgi:hypothetical protein